MKKYFKNFLKTFGANIIDWRELLLALIVGIIVLGFNVAIGSLTLLIALKILVPYAINIHVIVGFVYALFCKKITNGSVN